LYSECTYLPVYRLFSSEQYNTQPGEFIFEFFQQFNVNFETCPLVLSMIEEIIDLSSHGDETHRTSNLDSFLSFLSTIFRNRDTHMKVSVEAITNFFM
jgi:hypothetical protein